MKHVGLTLLLLLTVTGYGPTAESAGLRAHHDASALADNGRRSQPRLTAQDAAAIVQAHTGGRVLAVKRLHSQGRDLYRIKVLTAQVEVRVFYIDTATGAF